MPLLSGATLIDATSGGRPVPLVADGQTLNALVSGPGPFALTLEWGGPLVFRPGRASFVLPVPQAGAARATIDLPGRTGGRPPVGGADHAPHRSPTAARSSRPRSIPAPSTEVWWSMRDSAPSAAATECARSPRS